MLLIVERNCEGEWAFWREGKGVTCVMWKRILDIFGKYCGKFEGGYMQKSENDGFAVWLRWVRNLWRNTDAILMPLYKILMPSKKWHRRKKKESRIAACDAKNEKFCIFKIYSVLFRFYSIIPFFIRFWIKWINGSKKYSK